MNHFSRRQVLSLATGLALTAQSVRGAERWSEGRHYFRISPLPSKTGATTITEIFSYGCPACDTFAPFMQSIEKKAPLGTVVDYLPASWIAAENWPALQRAYLTAKALGIAKKTHAAMFAAVWKTGELAVVDPATKRLKSRLPSMQEIASFYQRAAAVPATKFLETSRSFSVESDMKRSDALIKTFRADSTPTIIVNSMYRLEPRAAGGAQQAVDLTLWLASKAHSAQ